MRFLPILSSGLGCFGPETPVPRPRFSQDQTPPNQTADYPPQALCKFTQNRGGGLQSQRRAGHTGGTQHAGAGGQAEPWQEGGGSWAAGATAKVGKETDGGRPVSGDVVGGWSSQQWASRGCEQREEEPE